LNNSLEATTRKNSGEQTAKTHDRDSHNNFNFNGTDKT